MPLIKFEQKNRLPLLFICKHFIVMHYNPFKYHNVVNFETNLLYL